MCHSGQSSSAVLSPWSNFTALLTVLRPADTRRHHRGNSDIISNSGTDEISADLPEVVNNVLGIVYEMMEQDGDGTDGKDWTLYSLAD